jgi:PIN domain nuclease of toxin-antitoxin system
LILLLDTHILLWWVTDDARLGPSARALIADPDNRVLISIVSLWEIAVKARIGKLRADVDAVVHAAETDGMEHLALTNEHLRVLRDLPFHHRDPFDHALIAQAITEGATLISDDRWMASYDVAVVS